jgi:hypothetical protein
MNFLPVILKGNRIIMLRILVYTLYCLAIVVSLLLANLKRAALAYDEVDYAFYAQFAARLSDPQLTDAYSAQPQGYNFLGYTGTDGKDNIHQSVHFEWIKYVYASLYWMIPNPLLIVFFIAVVYFLPVVYLALIHTTQNATEQFFILIFALLYIGIPSSFYMMAYDLRPRILMVPTFTLAVFAVHYQRPILEKLIFFGLLFLIREEALLFGPVIILYNFFRSPPGRERTLSTAGFGAIWLVFLLIVGAYIQWTGYETDPAYQPIRLILAHRTLSRALLAGGAGFIALFFFVWYLVRKKTWWMEVLQLLAYTAIFIPLGLQFSTVITDWLLADDPSTQEILNRFFFSPRMTLSFAAMLILLVLLRNSLKSPRVLSVIQPLFLLVSLISLGFQLNHLSKTITDYRSRVITATIVFQLRSETDRYSSRILTDYQTYQAFFDYENALLYQRLPWQLAGEDRYYPDNLPYLQQILNNGVDFIIIRIENSHDIQDLLAVSNLQPIEILKNEHYQIIQLP